LLPQPYRGFFDVPFLPAVALQICGGCFWKIFPAAKIVMGTA